MSIINPRMSRQAIQTKYIGPTDTKGSRIKAWCQAGSLTIPMDHSLGLEERHAKAAEMLAAKLGRDWDYIQGGSPSGDGYVFIELPEGYIKLDDDVPDCVAAAWGA